MSGISCRPENGGIYRPLVSYHGGKLIWEFHEPSLRDRPGVQTRPYGLRSLSTEQQEALDVLQGVARQESMKLPLKPGDMAFVNNRAILHAREEYLNSEGCERYIVRLWLKNKKLAWKLPKWMDERNRSVYFDKGIPDRWAVEPGVKFDVSLVERMST
jgi:hypothetical protein